MSAAHNAKARHYATLAGRIGQLQVNLAESERQMAAMTQHLDAMRRFAAANGAQFMAVSRLLDNELSSLGNPNHQEPGKVDESKRPSGQH